MGKNNILNYKITKTFHFISLTSYLSLTVFSAMSPLGLLNQIKLKILNILGQHFYRYKNTIYYLFYMISILKIPKDINSKYKDY